VRPPFYLLTTVFGLFWGCFRPKPLLGCPTCDVPGPLRCACRKRTRSPKISSLKRQASAFVIAIAAALLSTVSATADPSVASKQADARRVLTQINQIDSSLERARSAYDRATAHLRRIKHDLRVNRQALHVARANLTIAQRRLSDRLVAIYTNGESENTLAVLLGSTSLDDMLNRLETVNTITSQDAQVISKVKTFKRAVARHERVLETARAAQAREVQRRAAEKASMERELARQHRLLGSIRGEIAHLQAMDRARALASAAAARTRLAAQPLPVLQPGQVGATASTPEATIAPPSQYSGVVGIAMRYLGVPYVWGGASPGGFDCSGLVMYVFAQMGVSLPHNAAAQYGAGVPVSRDQLEPGDLVFFDGLGHVGIYIGNGQFIHAPHTGTVVQISSISGWYAATYVGARRII